MHYHNNKGFSPPPNMGMAACRLSMVIIEDSPEALHGRTPTSLPRLIFCYFLSLVSEGHSALPGPPRISLSLTFAQVIGVA